MHQLRGGGHGRIRQPLGWLVGGPGIASGRRSRNELVKLTITHTIDKDNSKLIVAVSGGWPSILSGLKTYLETGKTLAIPR